MLTLQPRLFSRTFFTTYVLAVEPAHACSLSVTVPHAFARAPAPPTTTAATTSAATASPPARTFILPPFRSRQFSQPLAAPSLCHPVERDPQREDRERCEHSLSEQAAVEPLRHVVTKRTRADEPGDDDDGEDHDQSLVHTEHDRVTCKRNLHLQQHL